MSMSKFASRYDYWLEKAGNRGWTLPRGDVVTQPSWHDAWVRYWVAMDEYERARMAGEADPGRPVAPHRSG